ncbi:BMP family lipoprotein [Alteribacter aurantiacus]|uniref:BMP family lipoprotein n=1 Tax=Alteribacter aurantiacus TaxID=254410 RepID=UPI00041D7873|nr:BMP family protein [Alteribacter aurantiacus]
MKIKLLAFLSLAVLLVLAACGGNEEPEVEASAEADGGDELRVALILPERIGVNPFFQQMDEGANVAAEEYGVSVNTIESTDYAAIEDNLRVAISEGYDLIITSSFESEDALTKVASENPDQQFAIIDTVVDLPNVQSVTFKEHEAAYLLGAAAGLSTETNKVGMIAAADIPLLQKWTVGFEEGLKKTNPDAEFLLNYVGGFDDPARAKELALLQASNGADFIAGAAAVGDLGVFEAAAEVGFYTSGQDIDRTVVNPDHVVLSQLKGTDAAAYETIKSFVEGTFEPGVVAYGLEDEGVGVTYITHESETPLHDFVSEDVIEEVKQIKDQIIAGELVVENPLSGE